MPQSLMHRSTSISSGIAQERGFHPLVGRPDCGSAGEETKLARFKGAIGVAGKELLALIEVAANGAAPVVLKPVSASLCVAFIIAQAAYASRLTSNGTKTRGRDGKTAAGGSSGNNGGAAGADASSAGSVAGIGGATTGSGDVTFSVGSTSTGGICVSTFDVGHQRRQHACRQRYARINQRDWQIRCRE